MLKRRGSASLVAFATRHFIVFSAPRIEHIAARCIANSAEESVIGCN